jgi:hypothetical protein
MLSKDRRSALSRRNITCTCPLCSSPDKLAESDRNLRQIRYLTKKLGKKDKRTAETVADLSTELMGLLEKESLMSEVGEYYAKLAGVWKDLKELSQAWWYAMVALDRMHLFKGVDSEAAEKVRDLMTSLGDLNNRDEGN